MKHIIERFLKMTTAEVFKEFAALPGAIVTRNYVFIQGIRDKPILLVGHADTVFSGPPGSVEWCGNLAKAGYQWSSKSNAGPSTTQPIKHSVACVCKDCKKEREDADKKKLEAKQAKVTVVQPTTNVIVPSTGMETVKQFALANGYTVHYLPDLHFTKGKKSFSYETFIKANMATMFKNGKLPKEVQPGRIKLTQEDVKKFAGTKGFIPFFKKGDVRGGELLFMLPAPSRDVITFEKFCMENAAELLRLKDEKNGIAGTDKRDYLRPVRRGVYTTAEKTKVDAAIEALFDADHRKLTRSVVDSMEEEGLLVTPEEIATAGERWAIAHPMPSITEQASAVIDTVAKNLKKAVQTAAEMVGPSPYSEADPDVNGVKLAKEAQAKAVPKVEEKSKLLDADYKGFDKDDVMSFANDLNFHTITSYKTEENTHVIAFQRGTSRYSWKGFVDKFSFGIEFERNKRLNTHSNKMWPFGDDKHGKAREDLMRKFAKEKGWDSDFVGGHMNFEKKSDKEKLKLDEFILRYIDDIEIEFKKLDDEFKDESERKVSKNALKKVTKLVNKIPGAVLNADTGTVTKDGITYTIHAFREQHDKKYAASGKKNTPVSTNTSIVRSTSAVTGYSRAMEGSDWGDDWGYGYAGSVGGSSYGSGRGLGADDRVGIAMIWTMRKSGHSILITDGEERGGIGAKAAGRELADVLSKHQFAIEIDRNFDQEMVFYQVATPAFKEYMVQQTGGFHIGIGSYTDIADVCESAGICGVNLAAGYWNQHTSSEMFSYDAWLRTANVVRAMLYDREHPRFPLPKYEPPKQGAAPRATGTPTSVTTGGGKTESVMEAALEGGDIAPVRNHIGEDWVYIDEEGAFFPQSNLASSAIPGPTQDDDLTSRDMPPMGEMQADGADEVEAEDRIRAKSTKNQSLKGLGVPATEDQQQLLGLHREMV